MTGILVASAVVTLMHWWRVRDRRLLPLMALFALLAASRAFEWWEPWRTRLELLAVAAGLGLLPMLRGAQAPGARD